jgi:hypothetical protein
MAGSGRSSLALRVPLDLATYERLARSARDAGLTLEGHAARVLVGAVGGERWQDGLEVAEDRLLVERRAAHDRPDVAADVAVDGRQGPGQGGSLPTRVEKWARSQQGDPGPSRKGSVTTLRGSVEPGVRS